MGGQCHLHQTTAPTVLHFEFEGPAGNTTRPVRWVPRPGQGAVSLLAFPKGPRRPMPARRGRGRPRSHLLERRLLPSARGPGRRPLARAENGAEGPSQPSVHSRNQQQQQQRLHTPTRERGLPARLPRPPPLPPMLPPRRPGLSRWLVTPSKGPEI